MIHLNIEDEDSGLEFGGLTIPVSKYRSLDAEPRTDILRSSKKSAGDDEEESKTFGHSRLGWYFGVCCEMVLRSGNHESEIHDKRETSGLGRGREIISLTEHVLEEGDLRTRDDVEEDEMEEEMRKRRRNVSRRWKTWRSRPDRIRSRYISSK